MDETNEYDCAIVGGGLAGLCLSIQLAQQGFAVIVLERNEYPFHKVCGEYISLESWNFLESLGLPLASMNLPIIDTIHVSAQNGFLLKAPLDLGGFGISRYTLDFELSKLARSCGVTVLENCKVTNIQSQADFSILDTSRGNVRSKLVCGSYGKIDPSFIERKNKAPKGTYIAVKYHIKTDFPSNLIELHNFKDGYCGISKVDNETYCLCYLTTAKNLQDNGNDIQQMEKNVLMQNPHLNRYFSSSKFIFEKPLAISKIGFHKKNTYQQNILLLGDAAGAIAPLCGNGMSIGMRASKILAKHITDFLHQKISKQDLILLYTKEWNTNFSFRIKTGYHLQKLFGKRITTLWSLKLLNKTPRLLRKIISLTHGQSF